MLKLSGLRRLMMHALKALHLQTQVRVRRAMLGVQAARLLKQPACQQTSLTVCRARSPRLRIC